MIQEVGWCGILILCCIIIEFLNFVKYIKGKIVTIWTQPSWNGKRKRGARRQLWRNVAQEGEQKRFSVADESFELDFGWWSRQWLPEVDLGGNKIDRCEGPLMFSGVANFDKEFRRGGFLKTWSFVDEPG